MNFITGSTGLVGKVLLQRHVEEGIPVKALIRNVQDKDKFNFDTSGVEWVIGDVLSVPTLNEAIEGCEYVFHCAAIVSYASKMEERMHKVNIEGTANIVNACLNQNVKKLCHLSSVAALGEGTETKPLNEENYFDESKQHTAYGYSKYYAELEVWRGIEEGLKAIVLNPTIILGPGDWTKSSTKIFKYVWEEHKYYIGGGYNFVDVRDVVSQMMRIAYSDKSGEQYILAGNNVIYRDLFMLIANTFNKKPPLVKAGLFQKRALLWWSNIKTFFTRGEPIITKDVVYKSERTPVIDHGKIGKDFPHEYYKIQDTVDWCCRSMKPGQ